MIHRSLWNPSKEMINMSKLTIVGAGGHGKVVAEAAQLMCKWTDICFVDDDQSLWGKKINECPVLSDLNTVLEKQVDSDFVVAIGDNKTREKVQQRLESLGYQLGIVIHPRANVSKYVTIGAGTVIMAGATINPSTQIGRGVIVNTNASVDHDNIIGNYVHLSPGVNLGGTVSVGQKVWFGMSSTVINNINIAENVIVGAFGLVLTNIESAGIYIGQPVHKKT